jgi:hypothetical protein
MRATRQSMDDQLGSPTEKFGKSGDELLTAQKLITVVRLARAQLWCEQFREEGEYVGSSGFVDFTQAFDQSALVHGPDLI